mmetsp:Transcript_12475/g.24866  ORF Transcript_12475/g.24866 Transcript_12475/m.24866 type:complete len:349 (+) Transcript_12475:310-1356(+)
MCGRRHSGFWAGRRGRRIFVLPVPDPQILADADGRAPLQSGRRPLHHPPPLLRGRRRIVLRHPARPRRYLRGDLPAVQPRPRTAPRPRGTAPTRRHRRRARDRPRRPCGGTSRRSPGGGGAASSRPGTRAGGARHVGPATGRERAHPERLRGTVPRAHPPPGGPLAAQPPAPDLPAGVGGDHGPERAGVRALSAGVDGGAPRTAVRRTARTSLRAAGGDGGPDRRGRGRVERRRGGGARRSARGRGRAHVCARQRGVAGFGARAGPVAAVGGGRGQRGDPDGLPAVHGPAARPGADGSACTLGAERRRAAARGLVRRQGPGGGDGGRGPRGCHDGPTRATGRSGTGAV